MCDEVSSNWFYIIWVFFLHISVVILNIFFYLYEITHDSYELQQSLLNGVKECRVISQSDVTNTAVGGLHLNATVRNLVPQTREQWQRRLEELVDQLLCTWNDASHKKWVSSSHQWLLSTPVPAGLLSAGFQACSSWINGSQSWEIV